VDNGVDPRTIHTLDDLKSGLDALRVVQGRRIGKDRLSVQDLTRRVCRHHDREVPRSTLANYLAGRTLPPPGVYESILRALDVPDAHLSAWADAWDRLHDTRTQPPEADADARAETAGPDAVARRRRGIAITVAAAVGVGVVTAGAVALWPRAARPAGPGSGAPASECAYSPVAVPIRVRPRASFGTGTEFQTISAINQVIIGGCAPVHAESGTSCSAQTVPIDTWIPVRFPYQGWVFSACMERIAPPPS
jgi:hypothetical protein